MDPATPEWDRPITNLILTDMPAPGSHAPEFVFAPDGRSPYALASTNGAGIVVQITCHPATPDQIVAAGARSIYQCLPANDPDGLYLFVVSDTGPGQIIYHHGGQETVVRAPNLDLLDQIQLSPPESFTFHAEGGPEIEAYVIRPVGRQAGQTYPLVLSIHGGPMMLYGAAFFLESQWLASLGYGIIYTNPRGSQGYGEAFCAAIQWQWGDRDYQDLMAELDQALARHRDWADGDRLAVMGGSSYGGYMANRIIGHSQRFKTAISMRSVVNWRAMIGTGDAGSEWISRAGGEWSWQDDAWYRQQSPITYVESMATPLLIEHQENDWRCPIEQAEILYSALRQLNRAPVQFIRYPDESHGMSRGGKPWHRVFRLESFRQWLAQYL